MNLELDHFFILVEPGAKVADLLLDLGFEEGSGNIYPGQGTSNRRFYFSNGVLEFLWVHDADEANLGPASRLGFPKPVSNSDASPFGVILHRTDNLDSGLPFEGWSYQPDYFKPPWAFHVSANSDNLLEPLCIYVPFIEPCTSKAKNEEVKSETVTRVKLYAPSVVMRRTSYRFHKETITSWKLLR